jgi:hypothetical protein
VVAKLSTTETVTNKFSLRDICAHAFFISSLLLDKFHIKSEVGLYWTVYLKVCSSVGPPLWSSGQSSWLQIQRSRVRLPALPDILRGSGSGTGSTQPGEDK